MLKNDDYTTLLNDALKRNETIVFSCKCKIRYSGRAESFLDWGDRIVVIKSDKALIIHQPTGNAPINYMKPQSTIRLDSKKGGLVLTSNHALLKENITVEIDKIHFFNSHKLEDGQSILVSGTEEDMSNMLYDKPHLVEEGFKPASREEQTKYGYIDVFGVDKDGTVTIVECKRYSADLGAVTQLRRYVEKIMVSKGITKVRGILAAPKITQNAEKMLNDWGYEFKQIHPPKYFEEFGKKQRQLDGFFQ